MQIDAHMDVLYSWDTILLRMWGQYTIARDLARSICRTGPCANVNTMCVDAHMDVLYSWDTILLRMWGQWTIPCNVCGTGSLFIVIPSLLVVSTRRPYGRALQLGHHTTPHVGSVADSA
jgi:hypothetical protein